MARYVQSSKWTSDLFSTYCCILGLLAPLIDYKNSSGDEIANVNLLRQHRTCRPRDQRLRAFNEFVISI